MRRLLLCLASLSATAQVAPPVIGHVCNAGRHWTVTGVPGNLLLHSSEETVGDCASHGAQLITRTGTELRIDSQQPLTLPDENWLLLAGPGGLGAVHRDSTQAWLWQPSTGWQQLTLPSLPGVIAAAVPRSGELVLLRESEGTRLLTRCSLADGRYDEQPVAAYAQLLPDGSLLVPHGDEWERHTATGQQPLDWTGPIAALRSLNATWIAIVDPAGHARTLLHLRPHTVEHHELPAPAEVQQ